jgi:DNA-damage-inducible protein J
MSKTITISARVEPNLKRKVDKILNQLGLTTAQAITLFLKQVELQQGLPFEVKIPNRLTIQAMEESQDLEKLEHFKTVEELYNSLGINARNKTGQSI